MQFQFDLLRQTRQNVQSIIDQYDLDALNHIPTGFNNNLIWNFGHIVITQQRLCYKLSGQPMLHSDELDAKYAKGSRPEQAVSQEELDLLRKISKEGIDQLSIDYQNERFKAFKTYPTSFGIPLNTIEQAIAFNNVHEGLHLGSIMAIRKHL